MPTNETFAEARAAQALAIKNNYDLYRSRLNANDADSGLFERSEMRRIFADSINHYPMELRQMLVPDEHYRHDLEPYFLIGGKTTVMATKFTVRPHTTFSSTGKSYMNTLVQATEFFIPKQTFPRYEEGRKKLLENPPTDKVFGSIWTILDRNILQDNPDWAKAYGVMFEGYLYEYTSNKKTRNIAIATTELDFAFLTEAEFNAEFEYRKDAYRRLVKRVSEDFTREKRAAEPTGEEEPVTK